MTRKDYIRIARALNQTYTSACESKQSPDVLEAILRTSYNIESELVADNPRFDRNHFMQIVRGVRSLESRPSKKQVHRQENSDTDHVFNSEIDECLYCNESVGVASGRCPARIQARKAVRR
jgi:hypothetical protein